MIEALATLLVYQLIGETLTYGFGLPIPGPVIGMALLLLTLALRPKLLATIKTTSTTLLSHLSLLFRLRVFAQLPYCRLSRNHFPQFRRTHDNLVQPHAPFETGLAAHVAALAFVKRAALNRCRINANLYQFVRGRLILNFAVGANHANQPLRHHRLQRRRNQKRLCAHVRHAPQRFNRVIGMDGRQHHMPRETGLQTDIQRFRVAHFAHQHHVRVLPQKRAHDARERQFFRDLRLRDMVGKFVLNRVFHRNDVALFTVNFVDARRTAWRSFPLPVGPVTSSRP